VILWRNGFMLTKISTFCTILRRWTTIILIYICELLKLAHTVNSRVKIIHTKHKPLPSNTEHPLGNFFIMQNHPPQPTAIHIHNRTYTPTAPSFLSHSHPAVSTSQLANETPTIRVYRTKAQKIEAILDTLQENRLTLDQFLKIFFEVPSPDKKICRSHRHATAASRFLRGENPLACQGFPAPQIEACS